MMRYISLLVVLAFFMCVNAKADLILERKEESSGVKYELLMRQGDEDRVIWETLISSSDGPLFGGGATVIEWCNLIAADQTKEGIIALIERNEFTIELLQFDEGGRLLSDLRCSDPGWLKVLRLGHRVTVSAPDRVQIHDPNGGSQTFFFSDGRITDENGSPIDKNIFTVNQTVRREVKRPNPEEVRSGLLSTVAQSSTGGSNSKRESERNSLWLAMTALIAGIGGLLWFFYRKQRSR